MRRRNVPATSRSFTVPAPLGGLNTLVSGALIPPEDCIQLNNMVASEHGLRSRLGEREWCTGLTGALDNQVRTMLSFNGSLPASAKVFAVTSTGIWDVTSSSTSPTQVLTFAVQGGEAGRGVAHGMTTAGGHFLLYCDEENGYHVYSESTGAWTKVAMGVGAGDVAGVDPSNFVFVTVWKSRAWFVEKNTAKAWYLPAGAIFGTATALNLDRAAQFRAGGQLVGLWNWTLDGGAGIDDNLVAISQGGDVAIYQGSDPASASTFALRGTWSVGAVPSGRNVATNFGGDILVLSKSGLRPLSQLVTGQDGGETYAPSKVANLLNAFMLERSELPGWMMTIHPEDNSFMVLVPTASGEPTEQLSQQLWNRSWCRQDLPMCSAVVAGKKLYFGTVDGKVHINDGWVDGVTLADPSSYTPIQWSFLTGFNKMGSEQQKQVQMIRPTILSESSRPSYVAEARFKYNLQEIADVSLGSPTGNVWDAGLWDTATWSGDYSATQGPTGSAGMGVEVAIAMRGTAASRTVVVDMGVFFTAGGLL
jgi:hypothetical protein